MENLHAKLKNHGKKVIIHLKRHHRKYLFGALCSGILALIGIHTASTINSTFADAEDHGTDIILQATATESGQTLRINKYFTNDYTVDRGDGITGDLTSNTTHTYSATGTYNITLSLSGADRWTFTNNYDDNKSLVPMSGTTVTGVQIVYMPSLAEGFGNSADAPGDYFFYFFNADGALTSLPEGSFDTSNITTAGDYFFSCFNGRLVEGGALTNLPDGSFNISNITIAGDHFFSYFNSKGALTSLPTGSFDTSNITSAGNFFFNAFNVMGELTSLPDESFKLSTGLITVGNSFFCQFNDLGKITTLPDGSFDTSNITSVGNFFFDEFNGGGGALTSLPEGSFDLSNITTAGNRFFSYFNSNGALTTLPDSFKLSSVGSQSVSGYQNAFNSSFILNKNVSTLVSGLTTPLDDRNVFSDNQPGRCGVDSNWLASTGSACSITYKPNGGSEIVNPMKKYTANTTGIVAGDGISTPTRTGYTFSGWYTAQQGGDLVETVIFPDMDGDILYAQWKDGIAPTCGVEYRAIDLDTVIAYITGCDEEIYQIDGKMPLTYLFHHEGKHEFWFSDEAGNIGKRSMNLSNVFGTTLNTTATLSSISSVVENNIVTINWETTGAGWLEVHLWDESTNEFKYLQGVELDSKMFAFPIDRTGAYILKLIPNGNEDNYINFSVNVLSLGTGLTLIPLKIPNCYIEYSTESPTNSDVIAYLTGCNENISGNELSHTFYETGYFPFIYKNSLNNYRYNIATVDWIDKTAPTCDVAYSTTGATTGNVTATLTCEEEEDGDITVTNNSGNMEYTFENTGTFTFEFQDLAGNTGSADAVVTWIDKTKLTCDIAYNTTGATTGNVTATLTGCSEAITGTDTHHTFTRNGTYTFRFQDLDGNTGEATATVTWIISWGNTTYFDVEGNIFRWNDLTICNPNKSGECITMMDRNLGATTNDISKTGSYGYHYQRGNNYGFTIGSGCRATVSQCSDEVTYNATTQQTNANEFGSNAPYTSRLFYKGHMDWTSVNNYNLRGGSGDSANNNYGYDIVNNVVTNVAGRQGPCPEGYHVPSIGERFKLLEYWKSNNNITGADSYSLYNSGVIIKFQKDLKIPFAGVRYYENAKTWAVGKKAYLWSSSPSYVDNMIHIQSESISFRDHSSAYGESVRCFKNPSNTGIVFSISFDDNIKPGEYATFTVKVLKDGLLYNNYTGTVLFTLTDKNGGLVNKKSYTIYNSGRYTFETSDSGRKIFYSGLKVNDAGTYILEIRGLRDGGRGSNFVFVGGKHNAADFEYDTLKFNPNYSDEMNQAYQYARYFDITTKNNIKNADMYSGLDRIAMAKMLTNYAENVLGKNNFNTGRNCSFSDVSNSLDKDYDYGVTKACQLGIMGVNMPNNKFYPNGGVTRAEFATALSRLLYNTKDGTERYYSTHITKLRREGIITNTDPSLQELRGYVMLMLKRVAEK